MFEVVLLDLLKKKEIITEDEALKIVDVYTLYNKLVSVGEIEPLSYNDESVIKALEHLRREKKSLADKLVLLRRLEIRAESPLLKSLIAKTIEKVKDVKSES